jgi:glycosyltransferase involved in cell wall biosynthesis
MKLLLVQPTGDKYGHFGVYIARLAQELSQRGNEVTICTNRLEVKRFIPSPQFEVIEVMDGALAFEDIDREARVRPVRYWARYFWNSWVITRAALRLVRVRHFDGIYLTDAEFLMASLALKFYVGTIPPLLMQVNASNFSFADYPGSKLKKLYKVIQREVFRLTIGNKVSAFSLLGEWHRPRLISQLRLPENFVIEIIPDGGGEYPEPIPRDVARHSLAIDWQGDIFLFMGILRRDKGIEELSIALRSLWQKRKDFRIILSGFPFEYHRKEVEQMFAFDPSDTPIIHMHLDYVSEEQVPNFFYSADSLLLPYNDNYKGSSGPLMKGACTFGLPVIVSDVSEMGRLAKKHELGFVSQPTDAYSLESAMHSFLEASTDTRGKIRKRALRLGEKNSWPEMARKYEAVFKSLIQQRASKIDQVYPYDLR